MNSDIPLFFIFKLDIEKRIYLKIGSRIGVWREKAPETH